MQKINKKYLFWSAILFLLFALWTALICFVDVKAVGPNGSAVGFSTLNVFFHKLTGVNVTFYNISDWGGLVPIAFCLGFAVLGLCQWIRRKNILKVDYSILLLGGFYIIVIAAYILFEYVVINYRPILINGYLEASYPSSTTLLVLCVMPTAIMQFNRRIKNNYLRKSISIAIIVFIVLMVVLRLLSGVHWLTDIIGGALVSASLVTLYRSLI